jgi:RNA polymerase sigma factor (TIGR02999 family)
MGPITQLLQSRARGNRDADADLIALVYSELKHIAVRAVRHERFQQTLNPTALVHELYLRISAEHQFQPRDRHEFFALAARRMRQVLVDAARERAAQKRGGADAWLRTTMNHGKLDAVADRHNSVDALSLEQALCALEAVDQRKARVVELRYFVGLEMQEIADTLSISRATAQRDWDVARSVLFDALS